MNGHKKFVLEEEEAHTPRFAAGAPSTFQIEQPLSAVLQHAKVKPRRRTVDVFVGQDKVRVLGQFSGPNHSTLQQSNRPP
jgi:hypothetical protein